MRTLAVMCALLFVQAAHGATYREACMHAYGNDRRAVEACVAMAQDVGRGRRVVIDTQ